MTTQTEAEKTLWRLHGNLDPHAKSSPPALTDVFAAKIREYHQDNNCKPALDKVINLSLQAGIQDSDLYFYLENMYRAGTIAITDLDKLRDKILSAI